MENHHAIKFGKPSISIRAINKPWLALLVITRLGIYDSCPVPGFPMFDDTGAKAKSHPHEESWLLRVRANLMGPNQCGPNRTPPLFHKKWLVSAIKRSKLG